MRLVNMVEKAVNKICIGGIMESKVRKIKEDSGLRELDWAAVWQDKERQLEALQKEVKAPNEKHAGIYDEDAKKIDIIMEETNNLIKNEAGDCVHMEYFDGNIELHKEIYIETIAKVGKSEIPLSTKLYNAAPYLYGYSSNADVNYLAQDVINTLPELMEESKKRAKIAQKGKNGEAYVSRVLNQYKSNFFALENIVIPAYDESGKTSETDVYIISSKGIFVCEVKNYGSIGQTLYIPQQGEWKILNSSGHFLASRTSAFVQNERHCNATRSFIREHLGIEVPIIPVVIIANDDVAIQMENPDSNIVIRANQINELVSCFNDVIDYETQKNIVTAFEKNKLDANEFSLKLNADRAGYIKKLVKAFIPYMNVNSEIAQTYAKISGLTHLISWGIIAVMAIFSMMPTFSDHWLGIVWNAALIFMICITKNTYAVISGIVSMIALLIVLNTASIPALVVSIIGFLVCSKLTYADEELQ